MLATLSAFLAGGVLAVVAVGYLAKAFPTQVDDLIAFLRK